MVDYDFDAFLTVFLRITLKKILLHSLQGLRHTLVFRRLKRPLSQRLGKHSGSVFERRSARKADAKRWRCPR